MQDWHVIFDQQATNMAKLNLTPLETGSKREEDTLCRSISIEDMEEGRQKEARCISNYIPIPNIQAFAHTLTAIAQILHIDPHPMMGKLQAAKIKTENETRENVEVLQTTRSRLELCFSRRWREHQSTIFLLLQNFVSPERSHRTRVMFINQRGLILQVFSNVDSQKGISFISKILKVSYTRLENLVILANNAGEANLDLMQNLRGGLPTVNVVMVSFGEREKLQSLQGGHLGACTSYYLIGSNGIKIAQYQQDQIILWYYQQNRQQILGHLLLSLAAILKRQRLVSNIFRDFQYSHHQFNQKQFLLRLFSFYFNFVSLCKMDNNSQDEMKRAILDDCTQQLIEKQNELEQRSREREVHSFTTNSTSLHCPVCKRRSKITCLKCCTEFGTKFGLCEINCFEKFHEDRLRYACEICTRRKVNDFLILGRAKESQKREEENGKKEGEVEPAFPLARNIEELREKWKCVMDSKQREYAQFMKMCTMKFTPHNLEDRIKLLSAKIDQISSNSLFQKPIVKKEE